MYGPGGAIVPPAGSVTWTPPPTSEKLNGTRRVPASNACVTDPNRMNDTLVIAAPSGVPMNSDWPYPTRSGVVPVMVGRAPLNKYGGE